MRRIEVRSDAALTAAELEPLLAVRAGGPLGAELVRRTLRSLNVAGLAAEAEAWTRPLPGGVELVLVLRSEIRVAEVELTGQVPLRREELAQKVAQKEGSPLREDRLLRGVYELEEALAAEGFVDAVVRLAVSIDETAREARVSYRIEPGERSMIAGVEVVGLEERVDPQTAIETLRSRPGRPFRAGALREDSERLGRFLRSRGYRSARIAGVETSRQGAEIDLVWRVELGPRVELTVKGAERKELAKRGLLPFDDDAVFDEGSLLRSIAGLRRYYQERGHYRVEVLATESREDGLLRLTLEVVPGPRYELGEVRFEGEPLSFERERLARLLATSPRRLLAIGSGRLVDDLLAEDLSNLRSFYALEGFVRTRIGPPRVEEEGDRLQLTIPIDEGERRHVTGVTITGASAVSASDLLRGFPLAAGSPYHPFHVDSGAERLRTELDRRGFRSAIVVPEIVWDESGAGAELTYRVLEGEHSSVESIVVRGNERTDAALVRRFLGLGPGDAISVTALLEAQRNLYGLGAFSRVEVSAPTYEGEFSGHQILVDVDEGRTRSLLLGAGYDSDSGARGLFRLSESNLLGTLTTVQLDALFAQREQEYRLIARRPYLGRWPVELRALAYLEEEERSSFDVRRRGVGLGVSREIGDLRVGLFTDYRLVEEDLAQLDRTIPRESQDARVASVTATLLFDRRDDPIDPRKGWSAALDLERATPLLQADADFLKLFGQATAVLPFGDAGTLVLSARGGALFPGGSAAVADGAAIDLVPVSELFYAGGRTTHRAYRRDELGIVGETVLLSDAGRPLALGGGSVALVNLDWRFALAGDFGGVVFVDGGNVWREIGDFDPGEAKWGAGVGLRYLSPLGPLRAEIGWKLDREPFEDPWVVSISIGNAF